MKNLILTCLLCAAIGGKAQVNNGTPYLFDDFVEATVYFKSGAQFVEKMNYNLAVEKFFFIDRKDNEVKQLSNPEDINVIKFGNRVFYPEDGKGIEILPTNPTVYVQYKGHIRQEGKRCAYGQISETSSIRSYGGTYTSGGAHIDFNPEKLTVENRYNLYWMEVKGKKKQFKNFKQFLKFYPKHKEELQKYIETNKVDFDNVEQIKMLCIHAESLQ